MFAMMFANSLKITAFYCTGNKVHSPRGLFKYLLRECDKLPEKPRNYYKFMVKQSFKQHLNESDPVRIKQIIERSYEDAAWVLKKYSKSPK